jgi:small subunit ribosomal protein S5
VLLKPAPPGTGVIAGGAVRAVVEAAGIQNVLTKSLGTTNPYNVVKATMDALLRLRDLQEVANTRGKGVEEI